MNKIFLLIISTLTLLAVIGCSQPAVVSAAEQKSNKPRETAPAVASADISSLSEGNSAFAMKLYQSLKNSDGNLFYSPYSISEALAMTWGGARGDTEKQMAAALEFKLAQDKLHQAFNAVDAQLAQRGKGAQGTDGKGFRLNVVNALWGQNGFVFTPEYLDLLAKNYGAGMRIVDYVKAPEAARQTINQWVEQQTEQRIKDLLPEGSITDLTRLVLTNAIYFNAAWASQFQKASTQDAQFRPLSGATVNVPMMRQNLAHFRYAEGKGYQAVELPYDGRELSMVLLLPEAEQFKAFEASLTGQSLSAIIGGLQSDTVNLSMPRFKIDSQFGLKKALSDLGMAVAFDESKADLSGMDGKKDLHISDVVHKAFVSVDEAGTEAAAATGVIVGTTSMPTNVKTVTVDHPFIFLIRDNGTGAILFIGRVLNPLQ